MLAWARSRAAGNADQHVLRQDSPEAAVHAWKGLVAARWSLVDEFDAMGRRYVLARRNEPRSSTIEILSPRERQVASWAMLGHSNKLIAYEMGISASTVSVLLHRAATKLRARTREELIAAIKRAEKTASDGEPTPE